MDDAFRDAPSGQHPDKLLVMDCWLAIDRGQQSHCDTGQSLHRAAMRSPRRRSSVGPGLGPGLLWDQSTPKRSFRDARWRGGADTAAAHPASLVSMKLEQLLAADENTTADTDAPHLKIAMPLKPLVDPYCDIDIVTSTPSPIRSTGRLVSKN
jgi:hypothetical protein